MKIRKALSLIAFFITLFCFLSVSASAHGEKRVYDNSNLISKDEAAEAYLAEFEEKTGVKIRIITTHDQYFALSEVGLNSGESAIILELIKNSAVYYYELYTYGDANERILDSEVDRILDNTVVYDNFKSGNFDGGIETFCVLTEKAYRGNLQEPVWKTILISTVLSFAIGGIVVACVVIKYKRKQKEPSYPLDRYARLMLDPLARRDEFMGSRVIKTRVNSSSGGSRSGGGGSRGRR
ncbi:MAG: TPM domain-containing protein [Clostridia bacterium]|nr:TPM domain-containing protein [Clostridia bacterium]